MAKNINFGIAPHVGDRIRGSMPSSVLPGANTDGSVSWTVVAGRDGERGNPCIGIAIGSVLSLPIWLVLVILYRFWV